MVPVKSRKPRLALVGSDSLRGREILSVFTAKKFPLASFELFDPDVEEEYSKLSQFRGEAKVVHALTPAALRDQDLVFLAADAKTSLQYGRLASDMDYRALDLGEHFNADPKVPLIVSGINDALAVRGKPPLVANPHAAAIVLSHILAALRTAFGVVRAVAVILEPVSAFAEAGIQELAEQTTAILGSSSVCKKLFPGQVAFNLLARTSKPERNGFSAVENRVAGEVRRILDTADLPLSLAIVLAPVFHTYSIMIHIELGCDASAADVEDCFKANEIFLLPEAVTAGGVSPATVAGKDRIHLGPIKKDPAVAKGVWIWAVADNLTVGSALNAYGIARALFGEA